MKRDRWFVGVWVALLLLPTVALVGIAQTGGASPGSPGPGSPQVNLFGGGAFPGGYLRYTYTITRQGGANPSTTTTEITPLPDGTFSVVSTSTETVPLAMVNIGFFGIPLLRLGVRVPEAAGGTIDLSPLANIASATIEPGKNYLLPDGARFKAGEVGTIAGLQVVFGTYTHADFTNVEIELAFPVDLTTRALLPFPAKMVFRFRTDVTAPFQVFSSVELTEFVYRP
jgi:hypothetical protein